MTKYTPGPWIAYDFAADWWVANPEDDSGPMLRVGSDHDRREANARLIAAAPELLEALELLLREEERGTVCEIDRQTARTAIAKATGESHD